MHRCELGRTRPVALVTATFREDIEYLYLELHKLNFKPSMQSRKRSSYTVTIMLKCSLHNATNSQSDGHYCNWVITLALVDRVQSPVSSIRRKLRDNEKNDQMSFSHIMVPNELIPKRTRPSVRDK
jgi:hypothetical protein